MFQANIAFSKNGADVLIEEFINMLGLNGYYAASSIFLTVFFLILFSQRKNFKTFDISLKYLAVMIIESFLYAGILLAVLQNIYLFQGSIFSNFNNLYYQNPLNLFLKSKNFHH